jgi:2-aminoadipate transaminase
MLSLAGGLPDATMFPAAELAAIAADAFAAAPAELLQYGVTAGEPEVRQGLATLFDGRYEPDRIVVTTGSQQGLDLLARTMINPGDRVVVSEPDYLGALQVFRSYGAELTPIAIDADGLDTGQLEVELRAGLRPACCYVVPHFHNPTGATMSIARRAHLRSLAEEYGFLVIEDDPYRALDYRSELPAEQTGGDTSLGPSDWVVELRSTSKTLAPGLRVGALAGPDWLIGSIVAAKQSVDLHSSTVSQTLAATAVTSGWYRDHIEKLQANYSKKRDLMVTELRSQFGDDIEFAVPDGGMFLWARVPAITDTADWLTQCLDHGVCFVPGAAFAIRSDLSDYLRLSFSTIDEASMPEAVRRLAAARY